MQTPNVLKRNIAFRRSEIMEMAASNKSRIISPTFESPYRARGAVFLSIYNLAKHENICKYKRHNALEQHVQVSHHFMRG